MRYRMAEFVLTGMLLVLHFAGAANAQSYPPALPGWYPAIPGCKPAQGSSNSPLKVVFLNIGNNKSFNQAVRQSIKKGFRAVSPYRDHMSDIAFYKVNLKGSFACRKKPLSVGYQMQCDAAAIRAAFAKACSVSDPYGIPLIAVKSGNYRSTGGEIIYLATGDSKTSTTYMSWLPRVSVHELSHKFGLADLYVEQPTSHLATGSWVTQLLPYIPNIDSAGCSRWCASGKPLSEYRAPEAVCLSIGDRKKCTSYNRRKSGTANPRCVWASNPVDYFGTQCVPEKGMQNTGMDCLPGTGCYFGAGTGQYAWRPVKDCSQSFMCQTNARKFDPVSLQFLEMAFRCCFSSEDASAACSSFRTAYASTFHIFSPYRMGSCGYFVNVS